MTDLNRRVCVAPMMDWTTRHCRYFMRLLSKHVVLYTEMLTTGALIYGDRDRFLDFDTSEHPVAVQLGGSEPHALLECARYCEDRGYDEINLNVGCPSDRVQAGRFGACLMTEPALVAECVAAMQEAVTIPVTVKTRLGVDERDSYEELADFIEQVNSAGCRTVILHARKAWLKGLSPKENREVPPLEYEKVHSIKRDFPGLEIIINGGFTADDEMQAQLPAVDGIMIGRAAYQNPYLLASTDQRFFNSDTTVPTRMQILDEYYDYARRELEKGTRLTALTRHILGLFKGQPGAQSWRRHLSERAPIKGAGIEVIEQAVALVRQVHKQTESNQQALSEI
jgi:tRNA-dihydrouridine synthase A